MTLTTTEELLQETEMKRPTNPALPHHDYEQARKSAVSWLGDRYLLAAPVNRKRDDSAPFYVEPRQWHTAVAVSTTRPS
jgi:hypothetical protein